MAENKRPFASVDNPETTKHVNLAALHKHKEDRHRRKGTPVAMATDRNYNAHGEDQYRDRLGVMVDTARMQLISPPPEEMLRRNTRPSVQFTPSLLASRSPAPTDSVKALASKRKRNQAATAPAPSSSSHSNSYRMEEDIDQEMEPHQAVEATPNPKPRKQGRLHARTQSIGSPTRGSFAVPTNFGSSPETDHDESPRSQLNTTPSKQKQKRVLVQSPHARNPDADFIAPLPVLLCPSTASGMKRNLLGARSSRRSVTPIPPYEPPKDVFTPPREVFLSPTNTAVAKSGGKSTKRKSLALASAKKEKGTASKTKKRQPASNLRVVVKQELPDIDLTAPMPPASPSDDPLLLSGAPEPQEHDTPVRERTIRFRRGASRQLEAQPGPLPELIQHQWSLPPSSPEPALGTDDVEAVGAFTHAWGTQGQPEGSTDAEDDSMMQLDEGDRDVEPVRLFDLDDLPSSAGGWSDSDNEDEQAAGVGSVDTSAAIGAVEEGEGEYTGKWTGMYVRTKLDPPSSATRGRMEEWGRPISPYPGKVKVGRLDFLDEEEEEEEEGQEKQQLEETNISKEDLERAEEEEVSRMSVEPEQRDVDEEDHTPDTSFEEEPPLDDRSLDFAVEGDSISYSAQEATQQNPRPSIQDVTSLAEEDEDEEEREVREMSVEYEVEDKEDEDLDASNENLILDIAEFSRSCSPRSVSVVPVEQPSRPPSQASTIVNHDSTPNVFAFPSFDTAEAGPSTYALKKGKGPQVAYGIVTPGALADDDSRMQDVAAEQEDAVVDDDDDDEESSGGEDPALVKITSADPRAAARAVAILKQHDYDCYTKIAAKRRHLQAKERRNSHTGVEDLTRESRRRNVSGSGVGKSAVNARRRSTLGMGVWGEHVYIPGSPAMTLPELLQEAEEEVVKESPNLWAESLAQEGVGRRDPFRTPLPDRFRDLKKRQMPMSALKTEVVGDREWTKEEWKQLDACFTDQRLDIGLGLEGSEEGVLAPVDMVSISDVVERFLNLMGGVAVVERFGDAWSRGNIIERTRALQRKQRSGSVARPSSPHTPFMSNASVGALGGKRRAPTMEVPDFTPLGRRAVMPRRSRPVLPPPVVHDAPFAQMPPPKEKRPSLPPTLLAPRYSHLLEEAISICQEGPDTSTSISDCDNSQDMEGTSFESEMFEQPETENSQSKIIVDPYFAPPTIGKRVKGFLFSYLSTLSKTPATARKPQLPLHPRLPLPPNEILVRPRGPVTTPARAPIPKPKHPKELVSLHPAPQRPTAPIAPRVSKPQRLVDLHPLPAPVIVESAPIPRPRRSSGSSVKDLVRGFEEIEGQAGGQKLKHVKSIGDWKKKSGDGRPRWKP
ncbi:hypothetical protein B0H34DRAFT_710207 [Crassisporium funariophilum]|nr:hypothetical protein B0H34DRAFT_710207 [Crassisporium funariophilum]